MSPVPDVVLMVTETRGSPPGPGVALARPPASGRPFAVWVGGPHELAEDRLPRRMGRGPHGTARQGVGDDAHARRAERRTPPAPDGRDREGVHVRGPGREAHAARPVRGP